MMDSDRNEQALVDAVRSAALPLDHEGDCQAVLDLIGDAHFVLLGEASHGTHEFYASRARITQALIARKGFHAVAVEGDWPDAHRINRFVRGRGQDASVEAALRGFRRFPTWMWRNADVVDFVGWLHEHNRSLPSSLRAGFYGLDLYSLHSSMEEVLRYLDAEHPELAALARERYACFDQFGEDSQLYGLLTGVRGMAGCAEQVVANLLDLRRRIDEAARAGEVDAEDAFDAEQNARLVGNAEAYYRSMYMSDVSSWNLRDAHMAQTLQALERHLGRHGEQPKIVVWAHNSHLGDARATEMGERRGELNLGQLMRERHGSDAFLVGWSTHGGSVTAASDWDAPTRRMAVQPARQDSYEHLMHATGMERFVLPLRTGPHLQGLREPRLERAIGVIYRPETERHSHYFHARLPDQFDALIHIDHTCAVQPLEPGTHWRAEREAPETYPSGK